ncbi:MAG: PEGA domain-containing protein [Polyangiaceae bacterium]|nr:PEGA domain-containing protein [Polyangiaceae bacterium]
MARARFKEGVDYYDKGQFEAARAAFLQAYALKKHPAVLLNLAWSCLKSGHVLEGERYFRQFLSEGGADVSEKQRADANDGINQAHLKLGRLEVAAAPAGTDVSVDGESVGVTPLPDPTYIEAGARAVKLRAPDGTTATENVTVVGGDRVQAHFARGGPSAPATATATPPGLGAPLAPEAPPPEAPAAPATTAAVSTRLAPSQPPTPPSHSHEGMSILPFVFGGVLVAAGAATAIVMKFARDSAQTKANETAGQISQYEAAHMISPARCASSSSMAPLATAVVGACAQWRSDNTQVNEDATIANVAIGVGAAALVGTVIYGIVYATHSKPSVAQATVTPLVGPSFGGLSLEAKF